MPPTRATPSVQRMDTHRSTRALALVLTAGALAACGTGDKSASPVSPSATAPVGPSATAAADPAAAEATRVAERFLAALVAKEHGVAYDLLSARARAATTQEQFAVAREQKTSSARSLGRTYRLTGTTGSGDRLTVTGEGRLADATNARIAVPMTRESGQWRVDEVPKAF